MFILMCYHNTIKMPIDVKSNSYAEYNVILMLKILNLKQVIMSEFQSIKTFLLKDILLIDEKKFLKFAKLKIMYHGNML